MVCDAGNNRILHVCEEIVAGQCSIDQVKDAILSLISEPDGFLQLVKMLSDANPRVSNTATSVLVTRLRTVSGPDERRELTGVGPELATVLLRMGQHASSGVVHILARLFTAAELSEANDQLGVSDPGHRELLYRVRSAGMSWGSAVTNVFMPCIDLFLDFIGLGSYIAQGRWGEASVVSFGMIVNCGVSTWMMRGNLRYDGGLYRHKVLNVMTLGTYLFVREAMESYQTRLNTQTLGQLKTLEIGESCCSLAVAVWQLFAAGLLPGYPALSVRILILRWLSILMSCFTIPHGLSNLSKHTLTNMQADGPMKTFKESVYTTYGEFALFVYQACEVLSGLTFILFSFVAGPSVTLVILAIHGLALCVVFKVLRTYELNNTAFMAWSTANWRYIAITVHYVAFSTVNLYWPTYSVFGRFAAVVRPSVLAICWIVMVMQWRYGRVSAELLSHLEAPNPKIIVVMAVISSVGYILASIEQAWSGRFGNVCDLQSSRGGYRTLSRVDVDND